MTNCLLLLIVVWESGKWKQTAVETLDLCISALSNHIRIPVVLSLSSASALLVFSLTLAAKAV